MTDFDMNAVRARLMSLSPQKLVALERISPAAYRLITKDLPAALAEIRRLTGTQTQLEVITDETTPAG